MWCAIRPEQQSIRVGKKPERGADMARNASFMRPDEPTRRTWRWMAPLGLFMSCLLLLAVWRYQLTSSLPLSVDEAYYVAWSKSLDWGYWTKPPLIAWAIGLARALLGESPGAVRAITLLAFTFTSTVLMLLAYRMSGSVRGACLAALLFATLPLSAFYGVAATTDGLLLACWSAAMLCLWLALEGKKWAWPLLGLAFGMGLLAKYNMLVFGLSALLVLLHPSWRRHWKTAGPYLALGVALLVFSPNVVWNLAHQMPTFAHTAGYSQGAEGDLQWGSLGKFLAEQWLIGNPVLVGACLLAMRQLALKPDRNSWFLLAAGLPILGVIAIQALLTKANANWAAPAYLGFALMGAAYLWERHSHKWLILALVFNLIFSAGVYHFQTLLAKPLGLGVSHRSDPYWSLRNWPAFVAEVQALLATQSVRSQWRVASEDRGVLAQVQAVLNLPPQSALGWSLGAYPQNHFDQHHPLPENPQQPVLLITSASQAQVLKAFPKATFAKEIRSDLISNRPLVYQAWWLGLP